MSNKSCWDKLKISQSELDNLLDLDLFSSWAIELNRILIHKNKDFQSFLITELSILFLSIIFFFPVNLLIFRKLKILANNRTGFVEILVISLLFALGILLIFNYYLWRKAKKLTSLTLILDKSEQYNQLIDNLILVERINYFNSATSTQTYNDRRQLSQVETALNLTKASLLKSINLEKILNFSHKKISDRQQLFNNLENDLIQFLALPENNAHSEYQQLLTEAIQIGLSVHKEVRKIQSLNEI